MCDIAQPQPDQFGLRSVAREVAVGPDDLALLSVDTFDGIGGVDHLSDGGWEDKERNHSIPGPSPGSHYRRILYAPWAALKLIQRLFSRLAVDGLIDRLEGLGQGPTLVPGRMVDAVTMHICSVVSGGTAPSASDMPLRPSVTAISTSSTPRALESVNNFIQNLTPSVLSFQIPRISRVPSGKSPAPGKSPCCEPPLLCEFCPAARQRK